MRKANLGAAILTILVFLAGIIAPVPECYVFRVVCPVKTSFAAQTCGPGAACPAASQACCAKVSALDDMQKTCALKGLKLRMKAYSPDAESLSPPALEFILLPSLVQPELAQKQAAYPVIVESRVYCPDPIPILLKKQSLLI